jgi:hypothetical protein
MKTYLVALCALFLGFSVSAQTPITITPTAAQHAGLQYAADQYNATAKVQFDANTKAAYITAQALLPVAQQVPYDATKVVQYVPLTAEQYAAWRFSDIPDSYGQQAAQAVLNDPGNQALLQTLSTLPPGKLNAIKASVQAQLTK